MYNVNPKQAWSNTDVVDRLIDLDETTAIVDEAVNDWWKGLASACMAKQFHALDPDDKAGVKERWKASFEADYKERTGATKMPGAYRSSKSLIMKAIRFDVELLDNDGNARGKTEVTKECEEKAKADKTNVDKLLSALNTVSSLIDKAHDAGENLDTIRSILADLHGKC